MKASLQNILAENDVKPLDDLAQITSPLSEPEDGVKTVSIRGLLLARNEKFIGVKSGDMIMKIPVNAVHHAAKDPAPPSVQLRGGVFVNLAVIEDADILLFRRMSAADFKSNTGSLPFVLSIPSKSKDYAVAAEAVADKNAKRQELADKLVPVWLDPVPPLYDPTKSTLNMPDSSFKYSVQSPYDSKETRYWTSNFECKSDQLGFAKTATDYKIDEDVFTSTDTNSDVKIAKGDFIQNTQCPYDTKTIVSKTQEFDTTQPGTEVKVTDFHDAFTTEISADTNSDVVTDADLNKDA